MAVLNRGDGSDGNITISSNKNLNTDIAASGRSHADMICYSVTTVNSSNVVVSATPSGISVGDDVLLINMQGVSANYDNVGNYETFEVDQINAATITFTTSKTKYYGNSISDDTNIGVGSSQQRVVLQRIPQYNNMVISGGATVTANSWNGYSGGVMFFRVKDTLTNSGTISVKGLGYRGRHTHWGGGLSGYNYAGGTGNPSAGICGNPYKNGSGAAHATLGGVASSLSGPAGSPTYGDQTLTVSGVYMGCAGGAGEQSDNPNLHGGGVLGVYASTIHNYGDINADACDTGEGTIFASGGGSGGSMLIYTGLLYMHGFSLSAQGGAGGTSLNYSHVGGAGGDGRIAVYYATLGDALSSNPTAYTSSGVQLPYKFSGTLNESVEIRIYNINTGELIRKESYSAGAYEVDDLVETTVDVVAKATDGEIKGYGDVVPVSS